MLVFNSFQGCIIPSKVPLVCCFAGSGGCSPFWGCQWRPFCSLVETKEMLLRWSGVGGFLLFQNGGNKQERDFVGAEGIEFCLFGSLGGVHPERLPVFTCGKLQWVVFENGNLSYKWTHMNSTYTLDIGSIPHPVCQSPPELLHV